MKSRTIDQLAKKNLELEKRLAASELARERSYFELMQLKEEVYSIKRTVVSTRAHAAISQSPASSGTPASEYYINI